MTSMAAIAIQAPSRNLVTSTTISTAPVSTMPNALIARERIIWRRRPGSRWVRSSRFQCRIMPACDSVNDTNTPDDVELDQPGDLGLERHDQHHRGDRQEDDAVGERQPVAAGVQLAGQVAVLGEDRAEHREAVERGVRGQEQDQGGDRADHVEQDRAAAEDGLAELGGDRLLHVVRPARR